MHYGYLEKERGKYSLRTRGNKKYSLEEYEKNYINTYSTYSIFNRKPITKNMRDRKGRKYTFMGTHDDQEEKLRAN